MVTILRVRDKFDLYLGSNLGRWTLLNSAPEMVASVKTLDPEIERLALSLGFRCTEEISSDYGISVHWPKLFSVDFIDKYILLMNIHPGIIPQSRGMYPVFWDTYLNQPAGASCHKITNEVDVGPLHKIRQVVTDENQTAGEIWQLVNRAEQLLVIETLSGEPRLITETLEKPLPPIGPIRTLSQFQKMKYAPDLDKMSKYEIYRLMLAVSHQDFDRPGWIDQYLLNGQTPRQWFECIS